MKAFIKASFRAITLLLIFAATSLAVQCGAQEWTRFRGPNGTGLSSTSTIPSQITPSEIMWRVELSGSGHSSPVLWGEKLFVTSAEDAMGKRYLHCFNARSGRELWKQTYDFKKYGVHQLNTTASSTPVVDDKCVYAVWPSPESCWVVASDHQGNEVWRRDLGRVLADHGGATSPIIVDKILIVGVYQEHESADGFVIGLDTRDGAVRWKLPRDSHMSAPYCTPMLYQGKDGRKSLIFTSTAHGMTAVDPRSGGVVWESAGLFGYRCVSSPIQAGDLLFATAGAGAGVKQAVAIRPGSVQSKMEASIAYRTERGPSYATTPLSLGDRIFGWGDGGIVHCLKADSGETVWSERVGGTFYGSPVCAAGRLYAVSAKGELVVVEASDQFKILGRIDLGEPSHATPAVANGRLYVRTLSHLICIGKK